MQDDARELELIQLFDLERPQGSGRSGTDAVLVFKDRLIPFELKSTTRGSVTTVRDFGPEHVERWRGKHWLIGFYDSRGINLQFCIYGSPAMMSTWISSREDYVRLDFELSQLIPELIDTSVMYKLVGSKHTYNIEDARRIQKRQYTVAQYRELQDLPDGYSPERMLEIIKERCRYLIRRGSTLNNPHIPQSYFNGWERITENHAVRLRELVSQALGEST